MTEKNDNFSSNLLKRPRAHHQKLHLYSYKYAYISFIMRDIGNIKGNERIYRTHVLVLYIIWLCVCVCNIMRYDFLIEKISLFSISKTLLCVSHHSGIYLKNPLCHFKSSFIIAYSSVFFFFALSFCSCVYLLFI